MSAIKYLTDRYHFNIQAKIELLLHFFIPFGYPSRYTVYYFPSNVTQYTLHQKTNLQQDN